MPQLCGVLESALYVGDLDRARRFYEQVLGMTLMSSDPHFCALDAGRGSVLLLFVRGSANHRVELPEGAIPPHDGSGHQHIAFAIPPDQLEAWAARLSQHGVKVESGMHWRRGGRSLFFRDPDGHLLEVATSPGLWPNADGEPAGTAD